MNTLEAIHSILKNLSKSEKERFVNAYTNSGNKQRYKDRVTLLLELEEVKIVDTEIIKVAWSKKTLGQKNDRAFQNAQRNLLDDLLHYLVTINPYSQNHPFEKEMMYADKLVQLGLHDLAYQRFKEILGLLESHNNPHWQGVVLRKMQMLIAKLNVVDTQKEKEFDFYVNLEKTIAEGALFNTEIYHFQLKLGKAITEGWVIQTQEDKEQFVSWLDFKILSIDNTHLPLTTFIYWAKVRTAAYRTLMDYEKAFQSQLSLVKKLDSNIEQFKTQKPVLLYSEHLDLADLCYRTGRITFAEEQLLLVEEYIQLINDNNEYRLASIMNLKCNIAYRHYSNQVLSQQIDVLNETYIQQFETAPALQVPIIIGTLLKSSLKLGNLTLIDYWYERIKSANEKVRRNNIFIIHIIYACRAYMACNPQFNINYMELGPEYIARILYIKNYVRGNKQELLLEKMIVSAFEELIEQKRREEHIAIFKGLLKSLGELPFNGYIYQEQIYEIFDIRNWIIEQITRLKKVSADS